MPAERKSFYTPAAKRSGFDEVRPQKLAYVGLERRTSLRRANGDRRGDIRFDLSRPDRRVFDGRRADDARPKFW